MRLITHKLAVATAVAAAFSLAATPAVARGHGGHHGGHHGGWGHHDDDWDIDGDDVLAGVLILGGIAAIAGIANSGKHREQQQQRPYPEPEGYPEDAGYQVPPADSGYRSGGMSDAVDTCVAEVEASRGRVGSVDSASRAGDGWYVAGELEGGARYSCRIDGAGQVVGLEPADYAAPSESDADLDGVVALAPLQKQGGGDPGNGLVEVAQVSN